MQRHIFGIHDIVWRILYASSIWMMADDRGNRLRVTSRCCHLKRCRKLPIHWLEGRAINDHHDLIRLASKVDQVDQFVEPLLPHRVIGEVVEQAMHQVYSSHVAAILLKNDALVVGCDDRGQSFLKNAQVLKVANGYLHCSDPVSQPRFLAALEKTVCTGRAANLLIHPIGHPEQRFSVTLVKMLDRETAIRNGNNSTCFNILCVLCPLDRRRFATVRQLMELFALSAAEARLTRALCQGNSLEEYASEQGLKLPTVRTQLRSVLAKTGTGRQATLIRLVAGIPVIREGG